LLGLRTHTLHSRHHVCLLSEKGIAKRGRPVQILVQHLKHAGKRNHGLNARIPVLPSRRFDQLLALEIAVLLYPALCCNDLQGISRSRQDLSEE
jgi:hypothetical protein